MHPPRQVAVVADYLNDAPVPTLHREPDRRRQEERGVEGTLAEKTVNGQLKTLAFEIGKDMDGAISASGEVLEKAIQPHPSFSRTRLLDWFDQIALGERIFIALCTQSSAYSEHIFLGILYRIT